MSADIQSIKKRATSIRNIGKITKSLETVSALQLKKTEELIIGSKPYTDYLMKLTGKLVSHANAESSKLIKGNGLKTLCVFISTNRGLVGGQNVVLARNFIEYMAEKKISQVDFMVFGTRALPFLNGLGEITNDWSIGEKRLNAKLATEEIVEKFKNGSYKEVLVTYNEFISMQEIKPKIVKLLPLEATLNNTTSKELIEPEFPLVFERVVQMYLRYMISSFLLEAEASEHAARTLAMKAASDNASSLSLELTQKYNTARQEAVTEEILEGAFHHG